MSTQCQNCEHGYKVIGQQRCTKEIKGNCNVFTLRNDYKEQIENQIQKQKLGLIS